MNIGITSPLVSFAQSIVCVGFLGFALFGNSTQSHGQSLNLNSWKSDAPLEISATNGVEWQQEKKVFVARGNAKAVRGTLTLRARELACFAAAGLRPSL